MLARVATVPVHESDQFRVRIGGGRQVSLADDAATGHLYQFVPGQFGKGETGEALFCDEVFTSQDTGPSFFQYAVCPDTEFLCGAYRIDRGVFHLAGWRESFEHPAYDERIDLHLLPGQVTG